MAKDLLQNKRRPSSTLGQGTTGHCVAALASELLSWPDSAASRLILLKKMPPKVLDRGHNMGPEVAGPSQADQDLLLRTREILRPETLDPEILTPDILNPGTLINTKPWNPGALHLLQTRKPPKPQS